MAKQRLIHRHKRIFGITAAYSDPSGYQDMPPFRFYGTAILEGRKNKISILTNWLGLQNAETVIAFHQSDFFRTKWEENKANTCIFSVKFNKYTMAYFMQIVSCFSIRQSYINITFYIFFFILHYITQNTNN